MNSIQKSAGSIPKLEDNNTLRITFLSRMIFRTPPPYPIKRPVGFVGVLKRSFNFKKVLFRSVVINEIPKMFITFRAKWNRHKIKRTLLDAGPEQQRYLHFPFNVIIFLQSIFFTVLDLQIIFDMISQMFYFSPLKKCWNIKNIWQISNT